MDSLDLYASNSCPVFIFFERRAESPAAWGSKEPRGRGRMSSLAQTHKSLRLDYRPDGAALNLNLLALPRIRERHTSHEQGESIGYSQIPLFNILLCAHRRGTSRAGANRAADENRVVANPHRKR